MKKILAFILSLVIISNFICGDLSAKEKNYRNIASKEISCIDVNKDNESLSKNISKIKVSYNRESLIKAVSYSTRTGMITFTVAIPKNIRQINYRVYPTHQVAGREYGTMLEKRVGVIKSSNVKRGCEKTISVPTGYYGKYNVYACYGAYGAEYSDTDAITSYFSGTKYTTKFFWTQEKIKLYKRTQYIVETVRWVGFETMAYATCGVVGAGLIAVIDHAVDYCAIGGDSSGDLRCIADEPKKGYSYRYRRSGKNISGGISQYLQVFNRKGQLLENIYMGKIPYTRIIKRF